MLLYYASSTTLGASFAADFAARCGQLPQRDARREIPLFRQMIKSLHSCSGLKGTIVEEYHGTRYLVEFTPDQARLGARSPACCELADLFVIAYDCASSSARMTFIQVKSERRIPASTPQALSGASLGANMEQWDVLANRPPIVGRHKSFPANLLQRAIHDSIGSFVFFLHGQPQAPRIYYSAAPLLRRHTNTPPNARYGYVVAQAPLGIRCGIHGSTPHRCQCFECVSTYDNQEFGSALFGLSIGEWILQDGVPSDGEVAQWLAGQLRAIANLQSEGTDPSVLATTLAELLEPGGVAAESIAVGARNLLILGTNAGPELRQVRKARP